MNRIFVLLAVISLGTAAPASAALFIGGVSVNPQLAGDGLMVLGTDAPAWTSGTFSWRVSDNPDGSWHYQYTFNATPDQATGLSHLIIELSLGVGLTDILNLQPTGATIEVKNNTEQQGNPGLPGDIFGIKVNTPFPEPVTISFDIFRAPVWGDFYAKGGSSAFAYNAGFLAADPANPPANGSVLDHILRPDTIPTGGVPELSSLAAWGVCLAGAGLVAYRRNRRRGMTA